MTLHAIVEAAKSCMTRDREKDVQPFWAQDATTQRRLEKLGEGDYITMLREIEVFSASFRK